MHMRADAPFPPADLAREELSRLFSTGFAGPCSGESNEMLAYLEGLAFSEKTKTPASEPSRPWLRLRRILSDLHLFPA